MVSLKTFSCCCVLSALSASVCGASSDEPLVRWSEASDDVACSAWDGLGVGFDEFPFASAVVYMSVEYSNAWGLLPK